MKATQVIFGVADKRGERESVCVSRVGNVTSPGFGSVYHYQGTEVAFSISLRYIYIEREKSLVRAEVGAPGSTKWNRIYEPQ